MNIGHRNFPTEPKSIFSYPYKEELSSNRKIMQFPKIFYADWFITVAKNGHSWIVDKQKPWTSGAWSNTYVWSESFKVALLVTKYNDIYVW